MKSITKSGWTYGTNDKVIQTINNGHQLVFNGDVRIVTKVHHVKLEATISFDQKEVVYDFNALDELDLAYAISIHKSQGPEYPTIIIPLAIPTLHDVTTELIIYHSH